MFEFELDGHIFDLALLDVHTLVEFDGPYHKGKQLQVDSDKDAVAQKHGYKLVRRTVQASTVLPSSTLDGI